MEARVLLSLTCRLPHPVAPAPTAPQILSNQGKAPERVKLFFFAGGVRKGHVAYSGGVRQAISDYLMPLMNDTANSDIVFIEGTTSDYQQLYKTSKFCLSPHGEPLP